MFREGDGQKQGCRSYRISATSRDGRTAIEASGSPFETEKSLNRGPRSS